MKVIEVIPNPYIALDKDGVPQGVVPAGMPGVFIGAHVDLVASLKTGKNRFYFPLNRDGSMKRRVVFSADIATSVKCGELIAVSKEDAAVCGIPGDEFLAPDKALAAEKAKALAYWQSLNGKDAKVGDIPREAMKPGDDMPTQTAAVQLTPTVKMTKQEG